MSENAWIKGQASPFNVWLSRREDLTLPLIKMSTTSEGRSAFAKEELYSCRCFGSKCQYPWMSGHWKSVCPKKTQERKRVLFMLLEPDKRQFLPRENPSLVNRKSSHSQEPPRLLELQLTCLSFIVGLISQHVPCKITAMISSRRNKYGSPILIRRYKMNASYSLYQRASMAYIHNNGTVQG